MTDMDMPDELRRAIYLIGTRAWETVEGQAYYLKRFGPLRAGESMPGGWSENPTLAEMLNEV